MKIPKEVLQGCPDIRAKCPACGVSQYVTGKQTISRHKVGFRTPCDGNFAPVPDAEVIAWLRERAENARKFADESRKNAAEALAAAAAGDARAARIDAFLSKVESKRETSK